MYGRILFAVVALLVTSPAFGEEPFRARLEPAPDSAAVEEVVLVATSAAGDREVRTAAVPGTTVTLPATVGEDWFVTCGGAGVWCPRAPLTGHRRGEPISIPLFPVSRLRGDLRVPRGETVPEELLLQGWVSTAGENDAPVEFRQTVHVQDGRFEATVPRAPLDLRIASEGWVPVYLWGWKPGGKTTDLGPVELRRGGSLAGFTVTASDGLPVAGARVGIEPLASRELSPDDDARRLRLETTTTTDDHGFFQFPGIAEGVYRLVAEHRETATGRLPAVDVQAGAETFLRQPLRLPPPLDLEVRIEPPGGAEQTPWTVRLIPLHREGRLEETTDELGLARFTGLDPGDYHLRVHDSAGSLVHQELRPVDEPDGVVHLTLPLIRVDGRVRLGGEPLNAEVELQTGTGDVWRYSSDREGRFRGLVRRPRRVLFATVRATDPEVRHQARIEEPDLDDDRLRLDLDLPDGRVSGFVVDASGAPVPGARVELSRDDGEGTTVRRSDDDGRFAWRGLSGGGYTIRASRSNGSSTLERLTVDEDGLPSSVTLVLRPRRSVAGTLRTADGQPVAGAELHLLAGGPTPALERVITSLDGTFAVSVPERTDRVVVRVLAPSVLAWSACRPLPAEDTPWELRLPPAPGGSLRLESRGDPDLPPTSVGETRLLTADGGFFRIALLDDWQTARGGLGVDDDSETATANHRFDDLAAGGYAVVHGRLPWWSLVDRQCGPGPALGSDWQWLQPAGDVRLIHDHAPHQRAEAESRRRR